MQDERHIYPFFGHKFCKLTGCKNQGELIPRTTSAQEILRIIPNSFIKVSLLNESVHEPLLFFQTPAFSGSFDKVHIF